MTWRWALAALLLIAGACGGYRAGHPTPVGYHVTMGAPERTDAARLQPAPIPKPTATPEPPQAATALPLRPPTPQPPVAPPRNRLIGPGVDVGIMGSVGGSCSSARYVPKYGAWLDPCQAGTWFDCDIVACPAMNGWGPGTRVTWYDAGGAARVMTIQWSMTAAVGSRPPAPPGTVHFQVCTSLSGARARVLSA